MTGPAAEHTTVKLAKALQAIPGMPRYMIERAVSGHYHDYLSPLDLPELQLVTDLRSLANNPATKYDARPMLRALADAVIAGEYTASKEEADEWARSAEGQETFRQLRDDTVFGGIVRQMEGR